MFAFLVELAVFWSRLELTAWRTGLIEAGFVAVFANDIVMVLEPSAVLAAPDVLNVPVPSGVNFGVSAEETPVG